MDPENQNGMAGIGAVRHSQQRWAESAMWITQSNTTDPAVLLDLCDDYLKLGQKDDAELTAELVKSLGAGNTPILEALEKLLRSSAPSLTEGVN